MLVASEPTFFGGKARVQVARSSVVVMSQVSSKQEETILLLPSPSLVAKTVFAIYSTDQKITHFFYGNTVFIKDF